VLEASGVPNCLFLSRLASVQDARHNLIGDESRDTATVVGLSSAGTGMRLNGKIGCWPDDSVLLDGRRRWRTVRGNVLVIWDGLAPTHQPEGTLRPNKAARCRCNACPAMRPKLDPVEYPWCPAFWSRYDHCRRTSNRRH
jgi:hypothetical protein